MGRDLAGRAVGWRTLGRQRIWQLLWRRGSGSGTTRRTCRGGRLNVTGRLWNLCSLEPVTLPTRMTADMVPGFNKASTSDQSDVEISRVFHQELILGFITARSLGTCNVMHHMVNSLRQAENAEVRVLAH